MGLNANSIHSFTDLKQHSTNRPLPGWNSAPVLRAYFACLPQTARCLGHAAVTLATRIPLIHWWSALTSSQHRYLMYWDFFWIWGCWTDKADESAVILAFSPQLSCPFTADGFLVLLLFVFAKDPELVWACVCCFCVCSKYKSRGNGSIYLHLSASFFCIIAGGDCRL